MKSQDVRADPAETTAEEAADVKRGFIVRQKRNEKLTAYNEYNNYIDYSGYAKNT